VGEEEGEEVSKETRVLDYCPPTKRGRRLWVVVLVAFLIIASIGLILMWLAAKLVGL
jgi:hypothetical protein